VRHHSFLWIIEKLFDVPDIPDIPRIRGVVEPESKNFNKIVDLLDGDPPHLLLEMVQLFCTVPSFLLETNPIEERYHTFPIISSLD
jgi:hypothetical protein